MADNPTPEGTHGHGGGDGHLDASGTREVVYCHQCDNEWWHDQHGLICPRCQGEITEIVTLESDPRPMQVEPPPHPFHNHNPWAGSDSDPEDADIEEHVTHGPGGSIFFSQTIRTSRSHGTTGSQRRRDAAPGGDPEDVMTGFQNILGTLMGPEFRAGQAGRSGPETLYPPNDFGGGGIHLGGNAGPRVTGGRFTFSTGPLRPRNADEPQQADGARVDNLATYDPPPSRSSPTGRRPSMVIILRSPPDQLPRILGSLFGGMAPGDENRPRNNIHNGMPPGLEALFASIMNASAHSGDAVYSQEALDQIISTLMEQHPTSNAPGPASRDAISALPKKKLDEKMLGPEGKGECSVCMDDVKIGDEVVLLPCSHWFHETCAGAWLSEHNTCPICRKGIEGDSTPANGRRSSQSGSATDGDAQPSISDPRVGRSSTSNSNTRNEARLDAIRNVGRRTPVEEYQAARRSHIVGQLRQDQVPDDESSRSRGAYSTSIFSRPRGGDDRYERRRDSRSSDTSMEAHNGSQSGGSTGPLSWLRDRFGGGNNNTRRHE